MIQNIKAHIQLDSAVEMTDEPMGAQKFNDVLLSDVVKTPSTDSAL